jgi:Transglycosylase SLT domain
MNADTLNYLMRYYSQWANLPANALMIVAMIESSYNPQTGAFRNVRNWATGATGLMQLRSIALADLARAYRVNIDPMNPIQSIVAAALLFNLNRRYLRHYTGREPDFSALLVAYNGGWTAGRYYMNTGRAPSREGAGYLAKANQITAYA